MRTTSKTVVLMILCALTLGSPASFLYASDDFFAQASDSSKSGAATVDELVMKALTHGTVRVIVGLGAGFQPEGEIPTNDLRNQRNATAQAQEEVLNRLASHPVTHVKRFKYVPYMAMEVDVAALAQLRNHPSITSIQEDVPVPPALAESVPLIHANDAWASGFTGSGQVVAILDTGVDKAHEFLRGKVVSEACFSTTSAASNSTTVCPNRSEEQIGSGAGVNCNLGINGCYHGTHVAGIAAGANSSLGFNGVAKAAKIISIQVFSRFDDGNGKTPCSSIGAPSPCVKSFTSDLIAGLDRVFALRNTYNIAAVNLSLGAGKFTSACDTYPTKPSIDNLRSVGIATVVASGNDSFTNALGAPACISTAISVGSTQDGSFGTTRDKVSGFSDSASFLNLLAPGEWIKSSVPGVATYTNMSGTSMAAPHVAGAWAILKSVEPNAPIDRVLSALALTGIPVRDGRNGITKPRIEVGRAADALQGRGGLWVGLSQLANNVWSFNSSEWALWNTDPNIKELTGDFNGDGKDDVMKFDVPSSGTATMGLWVGLSDGKGRFNTTEWAQWATYRDMKVLVGDFNGDGKDDVMKFDVPSSGTATMGLWVGLSQFNPTTGKWFFNTTEWAQWATYRDMKVLVGDFNSDGKADVMKFDVPSSGTATMGLWVGLSQFNPTTGKWFFNTTEWAQWATYRDMKVLVGDFNSDGKADVMKFDVPSSGTATMGLWVGLSQFNPTTGKWFFNTTEWAQWATYRDMKVLVGDFNSDGKADVMKFDVPSSGTATMGLWVGLSQFNPTTGKWFFNTTEWAQWATYRDMKVLVGDFNSDGKADVMKFDVPSSGVDQLGLWVGLSRFSNNAWSFNTTEWAQWNTSTAIKVLAGDFNGDRKTDVMKFNVLR